MINTVISNENYFKEILAMVVNYDSEEYLKSVDAYWRAANYLSVGQLFLMNNSLCDNRSTKLYLCSFKSCN